MDKRKEKKARKKHTHKRTLYRHKGVSVTSCVYAVAIVYAVICVSCRWQWQRLYGMHYMCMRCPLVFLVCFIKYVCILPYFEHPSARTHTHTQNTMYLMRLLPCNYTLCVHVVTKSNITYIATIFLSVLPSLSHYFSFSRSLARSVENRCQAVTQ